MGAEREQRERADMSRVTHAVLRDQIRVLEVAAREKDRQMETQQACVQALDREVKFLRDLLQPFLDLCGQCG